MFKLNRENDLQRTHKKPPHYEDEVFFLYLIYAFGSCNAKVNSQLHAI